MVTIFVHSKYHRLTVGMVFYGASYGSVDLGGNRYLNFALICAVDLPSALLAYYCVDRYVTMKALCVAYRT